MTTSPNKELSRRGEKPSHERVIKRSLGGEGVEKYKALAKYSNSSGLKTFGRGNTQKSPKCREPPTAVLKFGKQTGFN